MQKLPDQAASVALGTANHPLLEKQPKLAMRRDEVVQQICDVVAAECKCVFAHRLFSLILTGSAARDEITMTQVGTGWKLTSDAEFLVVVRKTDERLDSKLADSLKYEGASKLRSQGIDVSIDLAVVDASYLKELPPHIFSYELRNCGKVVLGDPSILEVIPKFTAAQLSKEDAWRLLCNRMIEQLAFVDDLENCPAELTPQLAYATVKLYLDMATSYLVFTDQYAPTYGERAKRLRVLADRPNDATPFPLVKFASRVAECTSWKLSGDQESCDADMEFWHEAISYMRRLWRWEMIQLTQANGELTVANLSSLLAEELTIRQRLRGWISVVKRRGWFKSFGRWPHWMRLANRSTPRYLVYRAATEIAFRLPCLIKHGGAPPRLDVNWEEIRETLPEWAPRSSSGDGATWRKLVDDVAWNYAEFLRGTRA